VRAQGSGVGERERGSDCAGKSIAHTRQWSGCQGGFENAKIEGHGKKEKGKMRGLHLAGDVRRRLEACMRVGRGDRA
jgi:hypothetical protein